MSHGVLPCSGNQHSSHHLIDPNALTSSVYGRPSRLHSESHYRISTQ